CGGRDRGGFDAAPAQVDGHDCKGTGSGDQPGRFDQRLARDARLVVGILSSSLTGTLPLRTWLMPHLRGGLSGRQRRNFVPWRERPPLKWSYCTSTTNLGSSGSHSPERWVLQRLMPPGDLPVKPPPALLGFFSFSI